MRKRCGVEFLAGLVVVMLVGPSGAWACPFCTSMGKDLVQQTADADLVAQGALKDGKVISARQGQSTLVVSTILKSNKKYSKESTFTLAQFLLDTDAGQTVIIFADRDENQWVPTASLGVESKHLVPYIQQALEKSKAESADKLGFYFQHLDSDDSTVALDAYKVFAEVPFSEVIKAKEKFDRKKIRAWLNDEKLRRYQGYRVGFYGILLGVCGNADDATFLKQMVEAEHDNRLMGLDGLLGGYCYLKPAEGSAYVVGLLTNPKRDLNLRYAAKRTIEFLLEEGDKKYHADLLKGVVKGLDINDQADEMVELLRRQKYWDAADKIVALGRAKDTKNNLLLYHRVVRYAVCCPKPLTKTFVAEVEKSNPSLVKDVREILALEQSP